MPFIWVTIPGNVIAPVIGRSETTKHSHWWGRPARNAGLPVVRHPGLRFVGQEMAGRDARRYQIVGTGVPAGAGFPVGHPAKRGTACLSRTGKMPIPTAGPTSHWRLLRCARKDILEENAHLRETEWIQSRSKYSFLGAKGDVCSVPWTACQTLPVSAEQSQGFGRSWCKGMAR